MCCHLNGSHGWWLALFLEIYHHTISGGPNRDSIWNTVANFVYQYFFSSEFICPLNSMWWVFFDKIGVDRTCWLSNHIWLVQSLSTWPSICSQDRLSELYRLVHLQYSRLAAIRGLLNCFSAVAQDRQEGIEGKFDCLVFCLLLPALLHHTPHVGYYKPSLRDIPTKRSSTQGVRLGSKYWENAD